MFTSYSKKIPAAKRERILNESSDTTPFKDLKTYGEMMDAFSEIGINILILPAAKNLIKTSIHIEKTKETIPGPTNFEKWEQAADHALFYAIKIYKQTEKLYMKLSQEYIIKHKTALSYKLKETTLSTRTVNILLARDISTLADLAFVSEQFILESRNAGKKTAEECHNILKRHGLSFNAPVKPITNLQLVKTYERLSFR